MSDGEAFIENEPLVYGPMTEEPKYWLAWALETTQACNGPRDSRPPPRLQVAGGSLRIQVETDEVKDVDCDSITPLRIVRLDKEAMDRILASATPLLRRELCRDYLGFPEDIDCPEADVDFGEPMVRSEQGFLQPLEVEANVRKLKAKLLR